MQIAHDNDSRIRTVDDTNMMTKRGAKKGSGLSSKRNKKDDSRNDANVPAVLMEKQRDANEKQPTVRAPDNRQEGKPVEESTGTVVVSAVSRVPFHLISGKVQQTNTGSVPGEVVVVNNDNCSMGTSSNTCGDWYETI